jgi:hypothetical protein
MILTKEKKMAFTVNSAFDEFNLNFVNIDSEKTKKATSSRDWLIGQLKNFPSKMEDFPRLYNEKHIKFGSFARNTKVKPLDDIDLMLTFSADGATYSKCIFGSNKYYIHTNNASQNLQNLSNDDWNLNSKKLINKLVISLNEIAFYKYADIHRRQEAATLELSSYEWNFDIVPAFFTVNNFYLVPDGDGNWKATDPRIDQDRVSTINQKYNGKVLQIIRTLKYWNRRVPVPMIPSYLFENVVLDFFEQINEASEYIDFNLRDFWYYLKSAIYNNVMDPKGFQGDLNILSFDYRIKTSLKAGDSYRKALEAISLETQERDQRKAINKWRETFGGDFPAYG